MRASLVVSSGGRAALALVVALVGGGLLARAGLAAPAPRPAAPSGGLAALATARIVDLTHPFDKQTVYWPNAPSNFQLEPLHVGPTDAGFFYSAYRFCAPEHGGTHLDAPVHFSQGGQAADAVPLGRLVRPAVVVDMTAAANADADHRLTPDELKAWETAHGRIPDGVIVLLRTGWSARWPDRKRYLGSDTPGDASHLHFPSYGKDAAHWLVDERKVSALGVDTASIDYGPATDFPVHQVVAAANVPGLENLTGLDALPATGAWIVALPMKIGGGSGGPLRAIALLP